jgi:hypothetical protein
MPKYKEKTMAKKKFTVLILAFLCAGTAFAQKAGSKAEPKMSVALDLVPTLTGFVAGEDTDTSKKSFFALSPVFEYAIGNYSIGARADFIFGAIGKGTSQKSTHVGLAALGRWYPLAKLQKLYLGAELGFDTLTVEKMDDPIYSGLTFAMRAGWKHIMKNLFLEPSLGYVISKIDSTYTYMPLTPSGWEIGMNIGITF